MKSKELSVDRDKIVVSHRSGQGCKTISKALCSQDTVSSIIVTMKKFGPNRTLPGVGLLGRESSAEMGEPVGRTAISAALHQLG